MRVITVGELTSYIKGVFERDNLLINLWVKGEVSNLKRAGSGHIYFTLKDSESCIRAVMFRSRAFKLRFVPEDGMAVRVRGYVSVYDRDGSYQLYAEELEPVGIGALYVAFEQLKEKLQKEGLFNPARKKKIPLLPSCIGVVTSPTGAAVRDIIEIISRRWPGSRIILAPVTVQGASAPAEVSRGIEMLNELGGVDVIIVGRGGGSLEELWAFNTEVVARSIYRSGIPVISAVGHETDYTIADLVADLRAATPSAAAELVVPVKSDLTYSINILKARLHRAARDQVAYSGKRLENLLNSRVFRRPVDEICGTRAMQSDLLLKGLNKSIHSAINADKNSFSSLAGRLNTLSPLATLSRGYSVCLSATTGQIIRGAEETRAGDIVNIELHRGSLS
ncbi:MAG: exodeoxyribonuclease VII large subunit, partial [Desulfocucumaceae bacterium]